MKNEIKYLIGFFMIFVLITGSFIVVESFVKYYPEKNKDDKNYSNVIYSDTKLVVSDVGIHEVYLKSENKLNNYNYQKMTSNEDNLKVGDVLYVRSYKLDYNIFEPIDYDIYSIHEDTPIIDLNINFDEDFLLLTNFEDYKKFAVKYNVELNYNKEDFYNKELVVAQNRGEVMNLYQNDADFYVEYDTNKRASGAYLIEVNKNDSQIDTVKYESNKKRVSYYNNYTEESNLSLYVYTLNNKIYFTFTRHEFELNQNRSNLLTLLETKNLLENDLSESDISIKRDTDITDTQFKEIIEKLGVKKNEQDNEKI